MRRTCACALHALKLERGWQHAHARRLERHLRGPPGSRTCERTVAFLWAPPASAAGARRLGAWEGHAARSGRARSAWATHQPPRASPQLAAVARPRCTRAVYRQPPVESRLRLSCFRYPWHPHHCCTGRQPQLTSAVQPPPTDPPAAPPPALSTGVVIAAQSAGFVVTAISRIYTI